MRTPVTTSGRFQGAQRPHRQDGEAFRALIKMSADQDGGATTNGMPNVRRGGVRTRGQCGAADVPGGVLLIEISGHRHRVCSTTWS
jgi:hypothetical protein